MTEDKCTYDYANKCDCSEDDKCGCTFPNNIRHDFDCQAAVKTVENAAKNLSEMPGDNTDQKISPRGSETGDFASYASEAGEAAPYGTDTGEAAFFSLDNQATSPLLLGKPAPDFTAEAVMADNTFKIDFNLSEYLSGSYGFIFFYPADFTFVCPSELLAYNQKIQEFTNRNVRLVAISVDSKYAHQTWKKIPFKEGGIGDINFPMVADATKAVTYQYGALNGDGTAMRASFLIDRAGIVRYQSANDDRIGRDPMETLRIIDALQFVETHGDVCPAGWHQGDKSLRPTAEGAAELIQEMHQ